MGRVYTFPDSGAPGNKVLESNGHYLLSAYHVPGSEVGYHMNKTKFLPL